MHYIRNCLVSLKSLDYFKFQPKPQFIGGEEKSAIGVAGTFLLLGIMLAYMAQSTATFFTAPPTTTILQSPTEDQEHTFVPTCARLPNIANRSWFGYTFNQIFLDVEGRKIFGKETPLPIIEVGTDKICIDYSRPGANNTFLRSDCSPGDCAMLKFKLWTCGTPDNKNPAKDAKNCHDMKQIIAVLQDNYVTISHNVSLGKVMQVNAAPKVNISSLYVSTFSINETRSSPDLLRWWSVDVITELMPGSVKYSVQGVYGERPPTAEVLEYQMAMAEQRYLTVRTRTTVFDLLGQFGAFWGVVVGALSIVFSRLNEKSFYERVPQWAQIDESFVVEKGAAAALQMESRKLLSGTDGGSHLSMTKFANIAPQSATYGELA